MPFERGHAVWTLCAPTPSPPPSWNERLRNKRSSIQAFRRANVRQHSLVLCLPSLEVQVKVHGRGDPTFGPFRGAAYNSAMMTEHLIPTGK
jgi:hypothetical protein